MAQSNTIILEELIKATLLEQKGKWSIGPLNPNSKLYKKIIKDPILIKGFIVKQNREKGQKLYLYHVSRVIEKYKGDSIRKFDTGEYNGKPIIYVYGPDKRDKKINKFKRNVYIMYRPHWLTDDMIDPKNNVGKTPAISHTTLDAAINKNTQNDTDEYNDVEKIIASDVGSYNIGNDDSQIKHIETKDGTYVGEMKDNQFHGQGTFSYAYGGKYVGEFKNNKMHGKGTYTWADGTKYVGEYKDGKKHGKGTMTWVDGTKYVGEVKDNKMWNGTYTWANGNIQKVKDGKDDGPVIKKGEETDVIPNEDLIDHLEFYNLESGPVNSKKWMIGGKNGDWDGSFENVIDLYLYIGKPAITSQKRDKTNSVWKAGSDHDVNEKSSYAIDVAAPTVSKGSKKDTVGDTLYNKLMDYLDSTQESGTHNFINKDGYSYQILWRVKDHFSHIHIGVRKGSRANKNTSTIKPKETYTITDSGFKGTYTGPEFDNTGDIAHQFSNTAADVIGKKLKELYKEGKYSRVDFSGIVMETIGMKSGTVTYKLTIPFKSATSKCLALTSFDHVGGWGHEPDLNKRKSELKSALMSGDSLIISDKKTTPEGLEEYWIQWRNKKTQSECGKKSDDTKNIQTIDIGFNDVKSGYKRGYGKRPVFKKGNKYKTGSIKLIQELLKIGEYDIGTAGENKDGIDDDFGGSLEKAIIKFQKDNNITPPNGIIDQNTIKIIFNLYGKKWLELEKSKKK